MKAKQSNQLTPSVKVAAKNGVATLTKPRVVAHTKNGSASLASISSPVKVKPVKQGKLLRAQPMSAKKLARLAKLKAYFDTLDEDTHIREFEQLQRYEMHYLACVYLAEDLEKGRRLT